MLAFDREEYLERIENTKLRMMQFGLDVLLVADPANMNYLTGYDGWSFYTPQVVVVALALDEPICVVRGIDLNGAKVTTFLDEGNLIGMLSEGDCLRGILSGAYYEAIGGNVSGQIAIGNNITQISKPDKPLHLLRSNTLHRVS